MKILTAKQPDPITKLIHQYNGWHFTGTNALDVFGGVKTIHFAAWYWEIKPDPKDLLNLQIVQLWHRPNFDVPAPGTQPDLICYDTNWFALMGPFARIFTQEEIDAGYDVTDP